MGKQIIAKITKNSKKAKMINLQSNFPWIELIYENFELLFSVRIFGKQSSCSSFLLFWKQRTDYALSLNKYIMVIDRVMTMKERMAVEMG